MKRITLIASVFYTLLNAGSYGVKSDVMIPKSISYVMSDSMTPALTPCDIQNIDIASGNKKVSVTLYGALEDGHGVMVINRDINSTNDGYIVNTTCTLSNDLNNAGSISYSSTRYLDFSMHTKSIEKVRYVNNVMEQTNTCTKTREAASSRDLGIGDEFSNREDFTCAGGELLIEISKKEAAGYGNRWYYHMKSFLSSGDTLDVNFLKRGNGTIEQISIQPDFTYNHTLYKTH